MGRSEKRFAEGGTTLELELEDNMRMRYDGSGKRKRYALRPSPKTAALDENSEAASNELLSMLDVRRWVLPTPEGRVSAARSMGASISLVRN